MRRRLGWGHTGVGGTLGGSLGGAAWRPDDARAGGAEAAVAAGDGGWRRRSAAIARS